MQSITYNNRLYNYHSKHKYWADAYALGKFHFSTKRRLYLIIPGYFGYKLYLEAQ